MQPKPIITPLLAVILLLGAWTSLEQLIQKPAIHFDSLGTRDMSLVDGTFLFRFNVANPNPVGVRLDDITCDLDINGEPVVSSRLPQGVNLAASGTSPMEIPVTINSLDFLAPSPA
jgi:LEA14-like dessication related protein